MTMGFVIPLYIIVGLESILGFFLMLPMPLCMPAVKLCRFSKDNQIARTVVNTSAVFLMILLCQPLYDTYILHKAKEQASASSAEELASTTSGEATSQLTASLTAAAVANMFLLRHLGSVIDEREQLKKQLVSSGIEPTDTGTQEVNARDVPLKAE